MKLRATDTSNNILLYIGGQGALHRHGPMQSPEAAVYIGTEAL